MRREEADLIKNAYALPSDELFAETYRRCSERDSKFGEHSLAFRYARGPYLEEGEVAAALDLIEAGVKHHAEYSSMGWSREEKAEQLQDPTSWVVLGRPSRSLPANADPDAPVNPDEGPSKVLPEPVSALLCFRFEPEDETDLTSTPVLYCYELHVADAYRRIGLGRYLVRELAHIAKATNMDRVMLTVLLENKDALAFYESLGFYTDETSPDDADYLILAMDPA